MPRFDGTGPREYGSFTGRGFGNCGRSFRYNSGYGRLQNDLEDRRLSVENRELDYKNYIEKLEKRLEKLERCLLDRDE